MMYYAHSSGNDKSTWQPLKEHLEAVSGISAQYAEAFSASQFAQAAGVLHDLGKYSAEFQMRLEGSPIRVDHSTAGAKEAIQLYGAAAGKVLAYAISGHHRGIPDYGSVEDERSLAARLELEPRDYSAYSGDSLSFPDRSTMKLPVSPLPGQPGFSVQFFIRMLYSCLVDADFLDTERAFDGDKALSRSICYPSLDELERRLIRHLEKLSASAPDTLVNRGRATILKACIDRAAEVPGFFSLTVPTGGGKTLSSLAFALRHAVTHGLRRVIYVIPFTSIIEQNAQVFRRALGPEAILEHHSNFEYPGEDSDDWTDQVARLYLATENWDAPLVVTTSVQFFESLFANKSSRCRKLHNVARSVIILDEAQMLPTHHLQPCLGVLRELTANYGSTVVLCTATQPALEGLLPQDTVIREIAPDPPRLYAEFRRVVATRLGPLDDAALAQRVLEHPQALCIVNTRAHARELYKLISSEPGAFHLSACMCPRHRSAQLDSIRQALQDGGPCRVVSTQLIEAGVDVDFPAVLRASAGLDSVAQAAGRCNREGRFHKGQLFMFEAVDHPLRGWFQRTASVAEMALRGGNDPLGLDTVKTYFEKLYDVESDQLDSCGILKLSEAGRRDLDFQFESIARQFSVIDSALASIVIPWDDEAHELIRTAKYAPSRRVLRRLQPYVVQVYPNQFFALERSGSVESMGGEKGMVHVLKDMSCYTDMGLVLPESMYVPTDGAWCI